jgi:hypothetical protein
VIDDEFDRKDQNLILYNYDWKGAETPLDVRIDVESN